MYFSDVWFIPFVHDSCDKGVFIINHCLQCRLRLPSVCCPAKHCHWHSICWLTLRPIVCRIVGSNSFCRPNGFTPPSLATSFQRTFDPLFLFPMTIQPQLVSAVWLECSVKRWMLMNVFESPLLLPVVSVAWYLLRFVLALGMPLSSQFFPDLGIRSLSLRGWWLRRATVWDLWETMRITWTHGTVVSCQRIMRLAQCDRNDNLLSLRCSHHLTGTATVGYPDHHIWWYEYSHFTYS